MSVTLSELRIDYGSHTVTYELPYVVAVYPTMTLTLYLPPDLPDVDLTFGKDGISLFSQTGGYSNAWVDGKTLVVERVTAEDYLRMAGLA